nr:hypothetical protein CFP56_11673 [Quercus suber]
MTVGGFPTSSREVRIQVHTRATVAVTAQHYCGPTYAHRRTTQPVPPCQPHNDSLACSVKFCCVPNKRHGETALTFRRSDRPIRCICANTFTSTIRGWEESRFTTAYQSDAAIVIIPLPDTIRLHSLCRDCKYERLWS